MKRLDNLDDGQDKTIDRRDLIWLLNILGELTDEQKLSLPEYLCLIDRLL